MTRRSFFTTLAAAILIRRTTFGSEKLEYGKTYYLTDAQSRSLRWLHEDYIILSRAEYDRWMKDRHIVATLGETHQWTPDALTKLKRQLGA